MQIDTINKRNSKSNGVIDLKTKKDNKVFKINYFKIILKDKKDIVFYLSLFLIMGTIIFFWVLSFRRNMGGFNMANDNNSKYQELKSTYNTLKQDLGTSVKTLKSSLQELNTKKENNTSNNNSSKTNTSSQQEQILNSLTDEQKKQILNKTLEENVPQEFSQEELKVRLDLLDK